MFSLIVPELDIKFESLKLHSVKYATGGNLVIKHLPDYSPVACSHTDECFELAEFAVLLVMSTEEDDMLCTLCSRHLKTLLYLKSINAPVSIVH